MVVVYLQLSIIGILSPPGDGMVIITLLTQVRKEKNGKIN